MRNITLAYAVFNSYFNIFLGLIEIQLRSTCDDLAFNKACSATSFTLMDRLSGFSQWRGSKVDDAGLWHLVGNAKVV